MAGPRTGHSSLSAKQFSVFVMRNTWGRSASRTACGCRRWEGWSSLVRKSSRLRFEEGLERAREAQQPLEFRVVLGLVLVRCQLEGQQRLLPISERTFRIRGGYNRNVTIAIGSTP